MLPLIVAHKEPSDSVLKNVFNDNAAFSRLVLSTFIVFSVPKPVAILVKSPVRNVTTAPKRLSTLPTSVKNAVSPSPAAFKLSVLVLSPALPRSSIPLPISEKPVPISCKPLPNIQETRARPPRKPVITNPPAIVSGFAKLARPAARTGKETPRTPIPAPRTPAPAPPKIPPTPASAPPTASDAPLSAPIPATAPPEPLFVLLLDNNPFCRF